MIVPIGEWVLDAACRTCRAFQRAGLAKMHIAVNVSAFQLTQSDLAGNVAGILEQNKIAPESIELEITETLIMSNPEKAN